MRFAPGLPPPVTLVHRRVYVFCQAKLDAGVRLNQHMVSYGDRPNDYDSISNCAFHSGPVWTIPHSHPDFRNKFSALHQSYTPNRERELYSMTFIPSCHQLTTISRTVHLTSVTDTRRTHTIISSGKLIHVNSISVSSPHTLPSS